MSYKIFIFLGLSITILLGIYTTIIMMSNKDTKNTTIKPHRDNINLIMLSEDVTCENGNKCPDNSKCVLGRCYCPDNNEFNSSSNCGKCGYNCPDDTSCYNGKCLCRINEAEINTNNNCGKCGNKCPIGKNCIKDLNNYSCQ